MNAVRPCKVLNSEGVFVVSKLKPTARMTLQLTNILLCLCLCWCYCFCSFAQNKNIKPIVFEFDVANRPSKERILNFPKEFSLGEIIISPVAHLPNDLCLKGAAKGRIVVPAKKYTRFVPSHHFFAHPEIIKTLPPDGVDSLWLAASSLSDQEDGWCDRALSFVGHLKGAIELKLDRSDATDIGAAHAADMPNLQSFSSFLVPLDGSCFKKFASLKYLRSMNLQEDIVKDENLQYLGDILQLEYLDLSKNGISDVGVKSLAKCTHLVSLNLSNNPRITSKSIPTLASLKQLQYLIVYGTSIDAESLLQLKNLPLKVLGLPGDGYAKPYMDKLQKTFPNIYTSTYSRVKTPDAYTRNLYAPLH
jgi:hypothetical protein